jgi:hypothetical protein
MLTQSALWLPGIEEDFVVGPKEIQHTWPWRSSRQNLFEWSEPFRLDNKGRGIHFFQY